MLRTIFLILIMLFGICGFAQQNVDTSKIGNVMAKVPVLKCLHTAHLEHKVKKKDARTIKIAQDGQMAIAEQFPLKKRKKIDPLYNSRDVKEWNDSMVIKCQEGIKKNLENTIEALSDTSNDFVKFYTSAWGESKLSDVINSYKFIGKRLDSFIQLKKGYKSILPKESMYYPLDVTIEKLSAQKYIVVEPDTKKTGDFFTLKVKKLELEKWFLVEYYNQVIAAPYNKEIARNASVANLDILCSSGKKKTDYIEKLLSTKEFTVAGLNELYRAYADSNNLTEIQKYYGLPWFRQWLWVTEGKFSTTPLGFTGDKQLRVSAPLINDPLEAKYVAYLDTVSEKFFRDSSEKDITKYKLAVLDNYLKKNIFTDSAEIKKELEENRNARTKFLNTTELISVIQVPYASDNKLSQYRFYSATGSANRTRQQTLKPMTVDDDVTVTIHNIPKDHKSALTKISSSPISDISPVTANLNEGLGILSQAVIDANGLTGILSGALAALNTNEKFVPAKVRPNLPDTDGDGVPDSEDKCPNVMGASNNKGCPLSSPPPAKNNTGLAKTIKTNREKCWEDIQNKLKNKQTQMLGNGSNAFTKIPGVANTSFEYTYFATIRKDEIYSSRQLECKAMESIAERQYFRHLLNEQIGPMVLDYVRPGLEKTDSNLKYMITLLSASSAPAPGVLKTTESNSPAYRSEIHTTELIDSATRWEYEVQDVKDKEVVPLAKFVYKTGKRHRIQASIGLTYTLQEVSQNKVSDDNGKIKIENVREQYGVAAVLHFYPFSKGVFLQDVNFLGKGHNIPGRINFMAGIDFRKVPDNVYLGIGYDLGPGIRINTGVRLYKYTNYEVRNDQIADKHLMYKAALPFIYLGIDPVSFVKAINIFKKS